MEDSEITSDQKIECIKFEKNWNNKLQCDYFTSIRLADPKYRTGKVFRLLLCSNGIYRDMGYARIISSKPLKLHQITEMISYSAKGMEPGKVQDALYLMYKEKVKDFNQATFLFLLLEKLKRVCKLNSVWPNFSFISNVTFFLKDSTLKSFFEQDQGSVKGGDDRSRLFTLDRFLSLSTFAFQS